MSNKKNTFTVARNAVTGQFFDGTAFNAKSTEGAVRNPIRTLALIFDNVEFIEIEDEPTVNEIHEAKARELIVYAERQREEAREMRAYGTKLGDERADNLEATAAKNEARARKMLVELGTEEGEIIRTLEAYSEASPGDIAAETDLSVPKIVAIAKKSPLFIYRASYRVRPQGCMRSEMNAGYYPATIRFAK